MKKLILVGVIFCSVLNLTAAEVAVRSKWFRGMIEAMQHDEEMAIRQVNHFIYYTLQELQDAPAGAQVVYGLSRGTPIPNDYRDLMVIADNSGKHVFAAHIRDHILPQLEPGAVVLAPKKT